MSEHPTVEMGPAISPLTEEEITELARDIVTNRVWIMGFDDLSLMRMSFMIIALATPDKIPSNASAVWEYLDKAGPLAVNGMPCFFSCHFVPAESHNALYDKITEFAKALGLIPKEGDEASPA